MRNRLVVVLVILVSIGAMVYWTSCRPRDEAKPKVAIFNLLSHPILNDSITGIKAGLAQEGFTSDKIEILEVNANGEMDKLNAFAKELLSAKPAVIVPVSTPVTQAVAKEASPDQKIVFSTVTNPSDVGMDKKPRNMTGVCDAVNYRANFDLIFELLPQTKRIGIIYNAGERNSQYGVEQAKALAKEKGVELKLVTVSKSQEVVDAARALIGSVDVIYVGSDNTVVAAIAGLTRIAHGAKLPVIASDSGSVQEGALAAVSVDYEKLGRRTGQIVAGILKNGKMPDDTAPVMFLGETLLLNKTSAEQLGYQFPEAVKKRAAQILP